ncbi:TadE/TadG family type IV pilus assembly protein [Thermophilibacter sp. ZX-H3]|uniref:TadE/TadG family type IV pilus assembly protein n=1 Tax=unclassified Thermophilibacter TaxID=2847308 RepID=UPI00404081C0
MGRELLRSGQSTVEAALLIPVTLTIVALLVQPACVLYTRSVMSATAHELARVVSTSRGSADEVRAYALRRLAAVPEALLFHEGGTDAWEVVTEGPDDAGRVSVSVEGRVRPLPLLGAIVSALGTAEGDAVVVRVEASCDLRASWIGGSYDEWVVMWG